MRIEADRERQRYTNDHPGRLTMVLAVLATACGSPDHNLMGGDAGTAITAADAGVAVDGGASADAGSAPGIHCKGTIAVVGKLPMTSFDVVAGPPNGNSTVAQPCDLPYADVVASNATPLLVTAPSVGFLKLVMRNFDKVPHDGTAFALTNNPTSFSVVYYPNPADTGSFCVSDYSQLMTAPSSPGSVQIRFTSTVAGSSFVADVEGPVTCDNDVTFTNLQLHVETVWQ